MSRSALWRQEGAKKAREEQAEELFRTAVEEGRNNRAKGLLPLWGPDDNFHLNPMLLQNIIKSNYFQKCCRDITDWSALVDEIYYQVKHLEPWAIGTLHVILTDITVRVNTIISLLPNSVYFLFAATHRYVLNGCTKNC